MPERDADILLEDITNALGKIERYIAGLDLEIIWQVIQSSLPEFKQQLSQLER